MFLYTRGEVIVIIRNDHLSDCYSSGDWQTTWSQKEFQKQDLSILDHPQMAGQLAPSYPELFCVALSLPLVLY